MTNILQSCKVWGSDGFVLEPKLYKDGIKILKWVPRNKNKIVNFSPKYSHTISLIFNISTHSVISQFHIIRNSIFFEGEQGRTQSAPLSYLIEAIIWIILNSAHINKSPVKDNLLGRVLANIC